MGAQVYRLPAEVRSNIDAGRQLCKGLAIPSPLDEMHLPGPLPLSVISDMNKRFNEYFVSGRTEKDFAKFQAMGGVEGFRWTTRILKYNEHHDHLGRFTFGPEGDGGGYGAQEGSSGTGRLTYDQVRAGLLAANPRKYGDSSSMPESEEERLALIEGYHEYAARLAASAPKPAYDHSAKYGSPEYRAYEEAQATNYRLTSIERLEGSIKSEEGQMRAAMAWVEGEQRPGSGHEMARSFHAGALDYIGSNLSPDYKGVLELYSSDYDRFAPQFIQTWLYSGGTDSQYAANMNARHLGDNAGKEFYSGDREMATDGNPLMSQMQPARFEQSENITANMERLYAETQSFYREKLTTARNPNPDLNERAITVYRGVSGAGDEYKPWAAESWSTQRSTAVRFGKMMSEGRRDDYTVLTAEVPYSQVLMSYEAQARYWAPESELKGKREIVALGGGLRNMTQERILR